MTKRDIATSIINQLNQPFNHELYERVKDRVVALRATLLRQSIGKYGIDELLQQTYIVDLEQTVDALGCIYNQSVCNLQTPIRAVGAGSPFKYVGTITGKSFTFLRGFEVNTIPNIPINARTAYYSIENKKIRTYNTPAIKIKVTDVFEDFDDLLLQCADGSSCMDDETILPMPADFVHTIISTLVAEFAPIPIQPETKVED